MSIELTGSSEMLGNRLRLARNSLDMTLNDISRQIGLPISTISDMERGKRQVSSIELFKLSKLYNRPVDFFFKTIQSSNSFNLLLRAVDESALSKESIMRFQDLCNNYSFLNNLLKTPDTPSPPDYSRRRPSLAEVEEIAERERSALGLNGQPIKDICDLLESKRGIKIFNFPEKTDRFFGAFTCDEACGACFLINSNNPARRRVFTIAHEYAHCIAHKGKLAYIDYNQPFVDTNPAERFADAFAAAFLMPKGSFIEVLNQLKSSKQDILALQIVQLAIYFGVSFEAAGWRLVGLQKLRKDKWYSILDQHIPSTPLAKFLGYDIQDSSKPDMLPNRYKYLCYQAYDKELISFERLAELLNKNFYELKNELGSQEG